MSGCRIELIIRGVCTLRPLVEGISDNISVYSIIGKYLEHPRIYYLNMMKMSFISQVLINDPG